MAAKRLPARAMVTPKSSGHRLEIKSVYQKKAVFSSV
jgi:hypothetical protein